MPITNGSPHLSKLDWGKIFPFLHWKHLINRRSTRADVMAGITGAIIVLPQGVAFAMIAGLPPEYGLYSAIVPAMIAALFGSSHHLISGPTTAISIVVFTTISPLAEAGSASYIEMVLTLTFIAGLFQFAWAWRGSAPLLTSCPIPWLWASLPGRPF